MPKDFAGAPYRTAPPREPDVPPGWALALRSSGARRDLVTAGLCLALGLGYVGLVGSVFRPHDPGIHLAVELFVGATVTVALAFALAALVATLHGRQAPTPGPAVRKRTRRTSTATAPEP